MAMRKRNSFLIELINADKKFTDIANIIFLISISITYLFKFIS